MDTLTSWIPNVIQYADEFWPATLDTLIMLAISGAISLVFGLIMAVAVIVTKPDGILPNKPIHWVLDKVINLFRAIPFVILIPMLLPLTRAIFHTSIGIEGALTPLVIGTVPFMARQLETAMEEIPDGILEASISMGMTPWQIITKVYLKENIPGMIRGVTITLIALIGQIAIVGSVGAGGLGDLAIRYGWQRQKTDVTYAVVVIILIIISLIQSLGNALAKKFTH